MKPVYLLPAFGWSLVVLIALSIPGSRLPGSDLLGLPFADKLVHVFLFLVFSFLVAFGLFKQRTSTYARKHYAALTLLLGVSYGIGTEVLQYHVIPERYGNLADAGANAIGTIFGLLIFRALIMFFK